MGRPAMGSFSSLDEAAQLHIHMLKLCGLVAFEGKSLAYPPTVLLCVYLHFSHCTISSMYVCNFLTLSTQSVYNVEILAGCIGLCGVHLRYVILFAARKDIRKILQAGHELWFKLTDQERTFVCHFIGKSTRVLYFYLSSNLVMVVLYFAASQLSAPPPGPNETAHRKLPYAYYADVQETPWYELSLVLQLVSILGSSISVSGYDTAPMFFIMIACGCLRALGRRLEHLGLHCEAGPTALTHCIRYHQEIIE